MRRPPRDPRERLFSPSGVAWGILQGLGVLALSLASFGAARVLGESVEATRAAVFTTVVIANLFLILGNRSALRNTLSMLREPNAALWWVVGGTVLFLALAIWLPMLRAIFHFAAPSPRALLFALAAGVGTMPLVDALKRARRRP